MIINKFYLMKDCMEHNLKEMPSFLINICMLKLFLYVILIWSNKAQHKQEC
jgi:hypothetical protein